MTKSSKCQIKHWYHQFDSKIYFWCGRIQEGTSANYQIVNMRRLSLEAPFVPCSPLTWHTLLITCSAPGTVLGIRDSVMNRIRLLLLISLYHNLNLAALTSSLDRITWTISWDLPPTQKKLGSDKGMCCDQHNQPAHQGCWVQAQTLMLVWLWENPFATQHLSFPI